MYHVGATLRYGEDQVEQAVELWEALSEVCCSAFALCASAGCSCVTGTGEKLCSEVTRGRWYRVAISEGPTWLTVAWLLPNTVSFDLYLDEEMPPDVESQRELARRLNSVQLPLFWREGTIHYSREKMEALHGLPAG